MKKTSIHVASIFRGACLATAVSFAWAGFLVSPGITAGEREPASASDLTKPGEPTQPRFSADRAGLLQTSDGLTLKVTTDLGSVKIVPLEAGSAPVVRYTVHIETDARAPQAQRLLERYSLNAKSTAVGVEIT